MRTFPIALVVVIGTFLVASTASGQAERAGENPGRHMTGSVRAGMEYDDNALRIEGDTAPGDFLARYFASLEVLARAGSAGVVDLSIDHGGKFFTEEIDADTLLTQVVLGYRQRLTSIFGAYLQLDMKDRTERLSRLDYNRGGAGAGIEFFVGQFNLRAGGAWRYFAYKPSPQASSTNVEGSIRAGYEMVEGLTFFSGYTIARRFFDTGRLRLEEEGSTEIFTTSDEERRDTFHVVRFGGTFRGPVVFTASYSYAVNLSNSFGQELTRNSIDITGTFPLLWGIYLSVHGELQRTTYEDPVLIDANFIVDEDNRNALVLSLARPVFENWEVETRYALYLQEFGVGSDYQRQTFLLAAGYLFE